MTNKEAVKTLLCSMWKDHSGKVFIDHSMEDDFLYAIGMAVSVLMKQEEAEIETAKNISTGTCVPEVWHDFHKLEPTRNGRYTIKFKDTGARYELIFKDGIWHDVFGNLYVGGTNFYWRDKN